MCFKVMDLEMFIICNIFKQIINHFCYLYVITGIRLLVQIAKDFSVHLEYAFRIFEGCVFYPMPNPDTVLAL